MSLLSLRLQHRLLQSIVTHRQEHHMRRQGLLNPQRSLRRETRRRTSLPMYLPLLHNNPRGRCRADTCHRRSPPNPSALSSHLLKPASMVNHPSAAQVLATSLSLPPMELHSRPCPRSIHPSESRPLLLSSVASRRTRIHMRCQTLCCLRRHGHRACDQQPACQIFERLLVSCNSISTSSILHNLSHARLRTQPCLGTCNPVRSRKHHRAGQLLSANRISRKRNRGNLLARWRTPSRVGQRLTFSTRVDKPRHTEELTSRVMRRLADTGHLQRKSSLLSVLTVLLAVICDVHLRPISA